ADSSWGETTIADGNAPPISASPAVPSGPAVASSWDDMDVTSLVAGSGLVSFGLRSTDVTALNLASRESGAHAPQLVVTTGGGGPDANAPSTPANPSALALGPTTIRVSWGAATDDVGVASYRVTRDGAQIATVGGSATSFDDTGAP